MRSLTVGCPLSPSTWRKRKGFEFWSLRGYAYPLTTITCAEVRKISLTQVDDGKGPERKAPSRGKRLKKLIFTQNIDVNTLFKLRRYRGTSPPISIPNFRPPQRRRYPLGKDTNHYRTERWLFAFEVIPFGLGWSFVFLYLEGTARRTEATLVSFRNREHKTNGKSKAGLLTIWNILLVALSLRTM